MTTTKLTAQLFRNLMVLGAGNYGAMAASLAINALLTRRLGVEAFGRLALLLMASQVVSLLVANWTQVGVIRFGAQEFSETGTVSEAFWTRVWLVTPWAFVGAVAMILTRERLSSYLSIPSWGVLVVLAHFLATFILTTVGAAFQAKNEMSRYAAVLFLDKAAMATLIMLLPAVWVRTPLLVMSMYAASSTTVAIGGLIALGPTSLLPIVFNRRQYRSMLSFSLPLILSTWAGLLGTNWFDFIVIKWYRPVSEIGLYSLGTMLAGVVQQVTIVFSTLLLPQLSVMVAKGEHDQIKKLVERVLPYWFLGTSALFGAVIIASGWVVPFVFGSAFERSVIVLALLMPASCALALFSAFSPLVSALGSTWVLTGICLASGLVNVGMDVLLIPRYGIAGAATATVVAYATSAALVLAFVQRHLKSHVFSLGLLALPVVVVTALFMTTNGVLFYVLAIPAGVLTVYALARSFRMFRAEDAGFFDALRLAARLPAGISLAVTRRR